MRRKRNLLLANGHPGAGLYPIGKLHDEAELVIERENVRLQSEAMLIRAAASSIVSKEAGELFDEMIERLSDGG